MKCSRSLPSTIASTCNARFSRAIHTAASVRNPGIDLLRGLASLLVILLHLRIRLPVKDSLVADILPHWLVKALTDRGQEAVNMFFVISG